MLIDAMINRIISCARRAGIIVGDPNSRQFQIDRLEYLIARDDITLNQLKIQYSPPEHCCPSCASEDFRRLFAKQRRRREWLNVLKRRQKKN